MQGRLSKYQMALPNASETTFLYRTKENSPLEFLSVIVISFGFYVLSFILYLIFQFQDYWQTQRYIWLKLIPILAL